MCGSQKKINFLKTKIACGFGTYPDTLRLNVTRKMLHVTCNMYFFGGTQNEKYSMRNQEKRTIINLKYYILHITCNV